MTLALTSQRRPRSPSPKLAWRFGGPAAAVALLAASQVEGPALCPIRFCTGHACPGCGLTRAVGAAVRGDIELSLRFHPLALFLVAQLAVGLGLVAAGRWSAAWQRRLPMVAIVNGVVLVAVWMVRWRLGLLEFVLQD